MVEIVCLKVEQKIKRWQIEEKLQKFGRNHPDLNNRKLRKREQRKWRRRIQKRNK
jgi:hypothetical protein